MAVLGVITLVMSILVPSIRRSIRQATAAVCLHHLHEIDQALQAYRLNNGGALPDVSVPAPGIPADPSAAAWYGRLAPSYLPDLAVLRCPADPRAARTDAAASLQFQPDPANASSYGMNDLIRVAGLQNLDRHAPKRPAETILLADMGPDVGPDASAEHSPPPRAGGRLPWDDSFNAAAAGLVSSWLTDRHLGAIHVLTIGGAVQSVPTSDLMREVIQSYYRDCAAGGCPLCTPWRTAHYSFAASRVYWWTGPLAGLQPD